VTLEAHEFLGLTNCPGEEKGLIEEWESENQIVK